MIKEDFLADYGLSHYALAKAASDFLRARRKETSAALVVFSAAIAAASAIPPRSDYLALDARVIERVENASLRVGTVRKDPNNPLFKEDKPWEVRFDNVYANVIFDQAANLYKCWYNPFIVDELTEGTPPDQRPRVKYRATPTREMGLCYAISRDGIRWEKPDLGVIDYHGSTANNLVLRGNHGAGVMKDPVEKDTARRYKLISGEQIPGRPRGFQVAFSPDGIHWSRPVIVPDLGEGVVGDTHNNAIWASDLGRYVGITRLMSGQRLIPPRMAGERLVMRTESRDFIHWTKAAEVLQGTVENQIYAMPIFRYADLYLGLVMVFNLPTDRVHCELAWSPDTIGWQRIDPGRALIPNSGRPRDYDWGCVYAAAVPVVLPSEIRLYYGSSDGPHTTWRKGFFALARLAPDRFAGYEAGEKVGLVVTRPIALSADGIYVNADAAKGEVYAEILTEEGRPIAGFSGADAIPNRGVDGLRVELGWKDRSKRGLADLKGRTVRLRFHLRNAKLYSFAIR